MSGKASRDKGQRAERLLFSMLSDELGFVVKRNIDQARAGGADCIEIPGWAVECKWCEQLSIEKWWEQTEEQAIKMQAKPILFYRQSRQPWKAVIDLGYYIDSSFISVPPMLAQISFETACYLIRESL